MDDNTPTDTDTPAQEELTIMVFAGELDKAMGAFIIANGASAMEVKVTMFFAFWGMNILRKEQPVAVKKDFMAKMFGWMMPRGANKLKLSNMNMAGMGTSMMKGVMKKKNVLSLPQLIEYAQLDENISMVACDMSMGVMGLTKEELIDGVEMGGVGAFVNSATSANSKGVVSFT